MTIPHHSLSQLIPLLAVVLILFLRSWDMATKDQINKPSINPNPTTPSSSDPSSDDFGFLFKFDVEPVIPYRWQSNSEEDSLSQNRQSYGQFAISTGEMMVYNDEDVEYAEYLARRSGVKGYSFDIFKWTNTFDLPPREYFMIQQLHQDFSTTFLIRSLIIIRYLWTSSSIPQGNEDVFALIALHYTNSFVPSDSSVPAESIFHDYPSEVVNLATFSWETSELMYHLYPMIPNITPIPALLEAKRNNSMPSLLTQTIIQSCVLEATRAINEVSKQATNLFWDLIADFDQSVQKYGKEVCFTAFDPIKEIYPFIPSFIRIQPIADNLLGKFKEKYTSEDKHGTLTADPHSIYTYLHRIAETVYNPPSIYFNSQNIINKISSNLQSSFLIPYTDKITSFPVYEDIMPTWLSNKTLDFEDRLKYKLSSTYKSYISNLSGTFCLFCPPNEEQSPPHTQSISDSESKDDPVNKPKTLIEKEIEQFNRVYFYDQNTSISHKNYSVLFNISGYHFSISSTDNLHPHGVDFASLDGHGLDQVSTNDSGQHVYRNEIIRGKWNGQVFDNNGFPLSHKEVEIYQLKQQLFLIKHSLRESRWRVIRRIQKTITYEILSAAEQFPMIAWKAVLREQARLKDGVDEKAEEIDGASDDLIDQALEEVTSYAFIYWEDYLKPSVNEQFNESSSSDGSYWDVQFKQSPQPPVPPSNNNNEDDEEDDDDQSVHPPGNSSDDDNIIDVD